MSSSERANKSAKTAADLVARGFYHGRRQSKPYPNSGGLTMTSGPGSSRYQRLIESRRGGRRR